MSPGTGPVRVRSRPPGCTYSTGPVVSIVVFWSIREAYDVAMSRFRSLIAAAGATAAAAAMTAVGAAGVAGASPKPAERILPGSAASFVSHTRPAGEVVPSTRLTIQLWLRPDLAAAARFATAVSTPGSALFHHYLSPAAYTAR